MTRLPDDSTAADFANSAFALRTEIFHDGHVVDRGMNFTRETRNPR
jgi:hypothetical protein